VQSQLYIRVRGRVLGPYDEEKLRSLARRWQLSRMHELSQDATNWVRASTYPELFVGDNASPTAIARQPSGGPQGDGRTWWYRKNGSEAGPVDQATLQQLLTSGNLNADDLVWMDGMAQWVPARQVPGLAPVQNPLQPAQAGVGSIAGVAEEKGELSGSLCKAATNSRPWVIFVAVISFIYAGLALVGGILALIQGANHHVAPVVAMGLFELIWGVDLAAAGYLLSNYASRVGSLHYSAHPVVLEKALDTLQTLWIFVSVNLIVFLAFLVFVVVWLVAIGGSLPWF
jgi:hypothetical protein